MLRLPYLVSPIVLCLAATALLVGCGPSGDALQPTRLNLLPGSLGPGDTLVAVADRRQTLRWQKDWTPMVAPSRFDSFVTGPSAWGLWSPTGTKFACRYTREMSFPDVYVYFFDRALMQSWDGYSRNPTLRSWPLAGRFDGSRLQLVAGLFLASSPDRLKRLAYNRVQLAENMQAGQIAGASMVASLTLPEAWPLYSDTAIQAAFLGSGSNCIALAGPGQVGRWDLTVTKPLEMALAPEQIAAQGLTADQARQTRLTMLTGPAESPAYAVCAAGGKTLLWRIPAQGPAEFAGDAQATGAGEIRQIAARPDGKEWAVLLGGSAPQPAGSTEGAVPAAPAPAAPASLYLTGPRFASPQAVDLQGRAPRDLAWSPSTGYVYFVLDDSEIWRVKSGQAPEQVTVGPPRASLAQKPGIR